MSVLNLVCDVNSCAFNVARSVATVVIDTAQSPSTVTLSVQQIVFTAEQVTSINGLIDLLTTFNSIAYRVYPIGIALLSASRLSRVL
jgi:hypothetical protein